MTLHKGRKFAYLDALGVKLLLRRVSRSWLDAQFPPGNPVKRAEGKVCLLFTTGVPAAEKTGQVKIRGPLNEEKLPSHAGQVKKIPTESQCACASPWRFFLLPDSQQGLGKDGAADFVPGL